MKQLLLFALAAVFALLTGCAVPVNGETPPPTTASASMTNGEFNAYLQHGEIGVQLVQTSATAALRAGKLSKAQDALIQKQVETVHDSFVLAKTMQVCVTAATAASAPSSPSTCGPAAAAAQANAATDLLNSLKKQTGATP